MFSWFKEKSENSRVYMCTKEVKWDLESSSKSRIAKILAITSVLENDFFVSGQIPRSVIDRPLDYSRNDLIKFYNLLETVRNANSIQLANLKKSMLSINFELPEFAENHAKNSIRALEVLMSTVGSGIITDRRDDVREIWKILNSSKSELVNAMDEIVETEKLSLEMTGQTEASGVFANLDRTLWLDFCEYTPAQFQKELDL